MSHPLNYEVAQIQVQFKKLFHLSQFIIIYCDIHNNNSYSIKFYILVDETVK